MFPKKPIYITMLREPIEQTISSFEMIRRIPKLRSQYPISDEMSLQSIIEFSTPRNLQTLYIANDVDVVDLTKSLDPKNFKKFVLGSLKEYHRPSISDEKLLEKAKKHLSEFAFVGLTEKFDESLLLLCYTFDWIPIFQVKKINVAKKRLNQKDLTKQTIDFIRERTQLDTELYNYGKQLFEQCYLEMIQELKEKYHEPRLSKISDCQTVYELLKKHYIKKHSRKKFLNETFQFNCRKINFIIRYGWETRIKSRLIKFKQSFSK